ncbi:hypothetical protein RUM44_006402 [Polyplax serrata]|uniref:Uncharacterized protein n=1 Tax=Polyplax serrata TaxID=468196 RepID=A0ABR1AI66_POLSC
MSDFQGTTLWEFSYVSGETDARLNKGDHERIPSPQGLYLPHRYGANWYQHSVWITKPYTIPQGLCDVKHPVGQRTKIGNWNKTRYSSPSWRQGSNKTMGRMLLCKHGNNKSLC